MPLRPLSIRRGPRQCAYPSIAEKRSDGVEKLAICRIVSHDRVVPSLQRHKFRTRNATGNHLPLNKRHTQVTASVQDQGRRLNERKQVDDIRIGNNAQDALCYFR